MLWNFSVNLKVYMLVLITQNKPGLLVLPFKKVFEELELELVGVFIMIL